MKNGSRNQPVRFDRYAATQDAYGEEVQAWAPIGHEYAAIIYGRGDERRQAAMEQGQQAVTFQVLSNGMTRGIGMRDRIHHGGSDYDIVGVAPDTPQRGLIEFTAVRAVQ